MVATAVWFDEDAGFLLGVAAGVPEWQRDAACAEDQPGADWFPDRGHMERLRAAKAVCARCLVQADCLAFALDEGLAEGVWGGATAEERKQLRKRGVTGDLVRRFGTRVGAGRQAVKDEASFEAWFDDDL